MAFQAWEGTALRNSLGVAIAVLTLLVTSCQQQEFSAWLLTAPDSNLTQHPSDAVQAHVEQSELLVESGDFEGALLEIEQAIELEPGVRICITCER